MGRGKQLTLEEREKIIEMRSNNKEMEEIAKNINKSVNAVSQYLIKLKANINNTTDDNNADRDNKVIETRGRKRSLSPNTIIVNNEIVQTRLSEMVIILLYNYNYKCITGIIIIFIIKILIIYY